MKPCLCAVARLLLVACICWATCCDRVLAGGDFSKSLDKAAGLQDSGKYEEALTVYDSILSECGDDPFLRVSVLMEQVKCYDRLGDDSDLMAASMRLARARMKMDSRLAEMDTRIGTQLERIEKGVDQEFLEKLRTITIPELKLHNVSLERAIGMLADSALANDNTRRGKKGVAVIYMPPEGTDGDDQETEAVTNVNLVLCNTSLVEAVEAIAASTNARYDLLDSTVVFAPKRKFITKIYRFRNSGCQGMFASSCGGGDEDAEENSGESLSDDYVRDHVKEFFIQTGVTFPPGACMRYDEVMERLVMRNTPENMAKMDSLIDNLDYLPYTPVKQVEVSVRFIEVDAPKLKGTPLERIFVRSERDALGGKQLSDEQLGLIRNTIDSGEGLKLLCAPRLTTKSGMNAEVKQTEELIYPTEFNANFSSEDMNNSTSQPLAFVAVPTAFETRDVGVILNVTPYVSPDGETINVTLIPQIVELRRWQEYSLAAFVSNGDVPDVAVVQPVFFARYVATLVTVLSGHSVVIAGLTSGSDDEGFRDLAIVVTATILDETGAYMDYGED